MQLSAAYTPALTLILLPALARKDHLVRHQRLIHPRPRPRPPPALPLRPNPPHVVMHVSPQPGTLALLKRPQLGSKPVLGIRVVHGLAPRRAVDAVRERVHDRRGVVDGDPLSREAGALVPRLPPGGVAVQVDECGEYAVFVGPREVEDVRCVVVAPAGGVEQDDNYSGQHEGIGR